jgi:hypothetical protein
VGEYIAVSPLFSAFARLSARRSSRKPVTEAGHSRWLLDWRISRIWSLDWSHFRHFLHL